MKEIFSSIEKEDRQHVLFNYDGNQLLNNSPVIYVDINEFNYVFVKISKCYFISPN